MANNKTGREPTSRINKTADTRGGQDERGERNHRDGGTAKAKGVGKAVPQPSPPLGPCVGELDSMDLRRPPPDGASIQIPDNLGFGSPICLPAATDHI